jgi:N-dimethylarginine dimethylaminohydrolase
MIDGFKRLENDAIDTIHVHPNSIQTMTVRSMTAQSMSIQSMSIQTMTAPLRQVLVCPPSHAGWNDPEKSAAWQDLGFHHAPDFTTAESQHRALCHLLTQAGAEVETLPPDRNTLTLDAVYTHDPSLPTNYGLIPMRPGKPSRMAEAQAHAACCLKLSVPVLAEIQIPATTEAGDIVWLDPETLLVGHGYRTNRAGIEQLRALLAPYHVEVISAPLPHGQGPGECLHLMSLMSMLDEATILVDLSWLAVETVQLFQARNFRLLEIDYAERDTLACNVLALGNKRLIALEENARTNALLRQAGFEVQTFRGSELCLNGNGGPTCLTRPLLRK